MIVIRYALIHLSYSIYILHYIHSEVVFQLPNGNQAQSLHQVHCTLLCHLIQRHKDAKVAGWQS